MAFRVAFSLHKIQYPLVESEVRKIEADNDATKSLERLWIPMPRWGVVRKLAKRRRRGADLDVLRAAFTLHNFQFNAASLSGGSKGCRVLLDRRADGFVCSSGNGSRKRMRLEEGFASGPTQKPKISAIPAVVRAEIEGHGGSDVCVVAEKLLTKSDMNKGLGRFLISARGTRVLLDLLTPEEMVSLNLNGEIRVSLIEPCLETREVVLKKWKVGGSFSFVLTGGWNAVVGNQSNGLVEGVKVQLGSYRSEGSLCFVLVKV